MNMYFHELKSHFKGLIGWSIGMIFLVGAGMQKYSAYKSSGQSINDLMSQFPHAVQVIFGMNGLDLSTPVGYFGVLYIYIAVMAAIYAAIRGADIIAKEQREKTAEFLLPKPVSRRRIIAFKLLAAISLVLILWIVTALATVGVVSLYEFSASNVVAIRTMMIGLLISMLMFLSLGAALAASFRRPKMAVPFASSMVLGAYILAVVININTGLSWLKYFSPFSYFEASVMVNNGGLGILFVWLSYMIIIICTVASFVNYRYRDL